MIENWKPCPGFEDSYSVSNWGRVRRDAPGSGTRAGRIKRSATDASGRKTVVLYRHRRAHPSTVHKLVALAFLGSKPSEAYEVAHENGDATDNRVENLRWSTHAENEGDKLLHGTSNRGKRNGRAKLTEQDVLAIRAKVAGRPQKEVAEMFGVHQVTVSRIVRRIDWGWLN